MKLTSAFFVAFFLTISVMGTDYLSYSTGEDVVTEFIFVNPTENNIQFLVEFYDSDIRSAEINLKEYGDFSYFFISIEPHSTWSCETESIDLLKSGYVNIDRLFNAGIAVVNIKHGNMLISEQIKQ